MRKANKARGEVAVTLGGVPLILCATMESLAALEDATDKGLTSFMMAVGDKRVSVLKAGVEALCIEGDTAKAFANLHGGQALIDMANAITSAMIPDEEGNAEAGAEKAQNISRSGNGSNGARLLAGRLRNSGRLR